MHDCARAFRLFQVDAAAASLGRMILPEDPEKEALQRQLDSEEQQDDNLDVNGHHTPRIQSSTTDLTLPPPPYNPAQLQRAESHSAPPVPIGGLGGIPGLPQVQQPQASTSQTTLDLPSSSINHLDVDDSLQSGSSVSRRRLGNFWARGRNRREPHDTAQLLNTGSLYDGSTAHVERSRLVDGHDSDPRPRRRRRKQKEWEGTPILQTIMHPSKWTLRGWRKRTWAIVVVSFTVIVAAVVIGLSTGLLIRERQKRHDRRLDPFDSPYGARVVVPWNSKGYLRFDPLKNGPPVEDGVPVSCDNFSTLDAYNVLRSVAFAPYGQDVSYATYYLDKNASSHFIHAMGDSTSGSIQVMGIDDYPLLDIGDIPQDQIRVDVVKRTGHNSTTSLVCQMADSRGRQGVGIYTQSLSTQEPNEVVAGDPQLSFFVLVRFPPPAYIPLVTPQATATAPSTTFAKPTDSAYIGKATVDLDKLEERPEDRLKQMVFKTDQMGLRVGNMKGLASFDSFEAYIGRGLIEVNVSTFDTIFQSRRPCANHLLLVIVCGCRIYRLEK